MGIWRFGIARLLVGLSLDPTAILLSLFILNNKKREIVTDLRDEIVELIFNSSDSTKRENDREGF
jgi:hypothetical protein